MILNPLGAPLALTWALAMVAAAGLLHAQESALAPEAQVASGLMQSAPMLMSGAASLQQPPGAPAGNGRQPKQVELLVQPNSPVRIECQLPPLIAASNKSRTFYWNFQRTSIQDQKPDLLIYGTDHINAQSYGVELDFDQVTGNYDLVIKNASYELNDGVYYCDFRDTAPDSRATINREFRLTVLIPPQPPSIAASSAAPAREGQEYQLNCVSFGGNPEPNITWFRNDQLLVAGAGLRVEQVRQNGTTTSVLTWIPTIEDHQAIFKCSVTNKAMSSSAPYEREVTLLVEYAPRIAVGPFNPLKVMQGDRATLSCQVDANPPVKSIRWLRDGHHFMSNQYNHTLSEVKISDAAVYSCQADNGIAPVLLGPGNSLVSAGTGAAASGSSLFSFFGLAPLVPVGAQNSGYNSNEQQQSKTTVEARLQLEVLYAPRVQIRESRSQPLNEHDYFALNCSADSWPPAYEFVWSKLDENNQLRRVQSSGSPTLELAAVSASDMGNYTCTAHNRLEPSPALAPSPGGGPLQQVYERQGSASHVLLVRHKPGLAEISVGHNGVAEFGNRTLIQCRAKPPGYPEPKYSFWRWQVNSAGKSAKFFLNKNNPNSREPTHTILAAKAEDEAKYGCSAVNELGPSSEAEGELIVNEVPQIIPDSTWRSSDERLPGHFPYSITVRASGKPEPRVSWFHRSPVDGRRIDLSSAEMQARFQIDVKVTPAEAPQALGRSKLRDQLEGRATKKIVISTLTFRTPLEVDDRGLYTVEFSNGLSRVAAESYQLHIHHAPIPAVRNQPVVAGAPRPPSGVVTRTRAGFNLGETVNLTCRVSAFPMPQFVWHSQSNGAGGDMDKMLEKDRRYRTSLVNTHDDIWESTMSFELNSEDDYGDYMCVTANQDSQTQLVSESIRILIHLGHKTVPEPPLQVEQVDASQDSVTLQWVPGFDGGYAQTSFELQYAPDDNSGLSLMRRFRGAQAKQSAGEEEANGVEQQQPAGGGAEWPRLHHCLAQNPCTINNLTPRQAYLVRVRARNELGASDFTEDLRVSTRANVSQVPRILEAQFDSARNILRFRVEPSPEYLLNNLEARIEVRASSQAAASQQQAEHFAAEGSLSPGQLANELGAGEWRRYPSVPIRHEQGEAYLNMAADSEQLRITLCSRLNESLCGQEFVLSTRESVASSFLRDQQGLSISILASTIVLIVAIGALATTMHSCCSSRKAKKAAGLARVDANGHQQQPDNKPLGGHVNGGLTLANGATLTATVGAKMNGSHGSTTSTNSTSANGLGQALHSMDSINGGGGGGGGHHLNGGSSSSDHSTDHSRQAKLDSMLPPNYSHYADRASLMLEQQQHQQAAAYLQDKLSSPFGLPAGTLLHPQMEPAHNSIGDYFGPNSGAYGDASSAAVMTSLEHQLGASDANNPMLLNSVLNGGPMYDPNMHMGAGVGQDQQSVYSTAQQHQQLVADYNNYNHALSYANQQHEQQLIESAYGTTGAQQVQSGGGGGGLMMAQPTQASYDNNANQSYSYLAPAGANFESQQQQQQQLDSNQSYQQDLAAAQQQMYGTLTRNSNSHNSNNSPSQLHQDAYMSTAGLMPPPPPAQQESDYGTTGGRSGRLIREIIV